MEELILVTGVTGTVGHEVAKALLNKNVKIRVGVRDINKIKNMSWFSRVESVTLDYEKPETIKNALKDISKLFLVMPPGTYQEEHVAKSILREAEGQKLTHIVRLSGMGARVSTAVEEILNRKPIALKQFIIDYRDKFVF